MQDRNLWLLLSLEINRSQELRSVTSYISPQTAVSIVCCSNSVCGLSLGLLLLVSDPSTTIVVPPYIFVDFIWFVFNSRANFKACLKTKACQNSVCSHYCLIGQNYRPEITSAYSGNLWVLVIFILEQFLCRNDLNIQECCNVFHLQDWWHCRKENFLILFH